MFSKSNRGYILLLINLILSVLFINNLLFNSNDGIIDTVVSDNKTNYTSFDKWLINDLGVQSVPCNIIIKNNKVVNIIEKPISSKEFTVQKHLSNCKYKVWEKDLVTISNKKIKLKDYDLVYIVKKNCPACEMQKENELIIFNDNKELNILVYYIKTSKSDIIGDCNNGCL